jgi:integrase
VPPGISSYSNAAAVPIAGTSWISSSHRSTVCWSIASRINLRLTTLCRRAGVTRLTPHGLRHSGATWMARLGENPTVIADRIGHTSVQFTLDNYIHPDEESQREAANRLDDAERRFQSRA